ncbi:MAG TPA: DEAD/DEAH box helicase [Pirellulales bacterium]|jgi:ATP-dependent RNA helicase RhlE|nr:DEAD/DEAH box helicase [Pirellulales bacterium]
MIQFSDLGLAEHLLRAVREEGYQTPTPIQAQAIGPVREGRDVLGCAQTGTGKTAAFALPLLDRLAQKPCQLNGRGRKIRVLVLAPTRELTSQIAGSFHTYGRHLHQRCALVYGGVSQNPQVRALNQGLDILVATPGRLLDLMNQGFVDLSRVESLVLDEADQMLDMGFIPDLRRIVAKVPASRQTLLFSATMPSEIRELAKTWLRDPVTVQVAPVSAPAERISQSVFHVEQGHKSHLLVHWLKRTRSTRTLVFTRTKHGADKVVRHLAKSAIRAEAIHGNKSQSARERALRLFKSQHPPVLVATDIASRGLDIDDVSHVVNFDLPLTAEAYVHRIGRTARAGASGEAVSFCDRSERSQLKAIERLIRQTLRIENDQPQYPARSEPVIRPPEPAEPRGRKQPVARGNRPSHNKGAATDTPPRRRRRVRNRANTQRV